MTEQGSCSFARALAGVAVLAVVPGCIIPMRYAGYLPAGAGTLESGYCMHGVGDQLRIRAPAGIELLVYTTHSYEAELQVVVSVPRGVTARFEADTPVVLKSPEWAEPLVWTILRASSQSSSFGAPATLGGGAGPGPREYWLAFRGANRNESIQVIPPVRSFTVELPAFMAGSERYQPPPVTFEYRKAWGYYTCFQ